MPCRVVNQTGQPLELHLPSGVRMLAAHEAALLDDADAAAPQMRALLGQQVVAVTAVAVELPAEPEEAAPSEAGPRGSAKAAGAGGRKSK